MDRYLAKLIGRRQRTEEVEPPVVEPSQSNVLQWDATRKAERRVPTRSTSTQRK